MLSQTGLTAIMQIQPSDVRAIATGKTMNDNAWQTEIAPRNSSSTGFMRRDMETAALVEQGIELQIQAGTKYAAVFLDYKGVPVDIALRVLLRPNQRRRIGLSGYTPAIYS